MVSTMCSTRYREVHGSERKRLTGLEVVIHVGLLGSEQRRSEPDHEGIVTLPTIDVARTTSTEQLGLGKEEEIISGPAEHLVVAKVVDQGIGIETAFQDVIASIAHQHIGISCHRQDDRYRPRPT